jgi:O-antigen ligase
VFFYLFIFAAKGDEIFMRFLFLMDSKSGLLSIKDKILYALVVIFFITFYMPDWPAVNNSVIGGMALFSFFYNSFKEKFDLLAKRKELILMIGFYLLHIVSSFLSQNQHEGFAWTTIRMPLLVFPIIIGLLYIGQELKERILFSYAVITTVAIILCFISAIKAYIVTGDASLMYNDNLTLLIDKQSIYISLMTNIAIFSFAYLLTIKAKAVSKRGLVYVALGILVIANFLMASRIGIIILYSSAFCFGVWYAITKKKILQVAMVIMGLVVAALLFVRVFPKTLNRFRELEYTNYNYTHRGVESHFNMPVTQDQWNGANIRLAVWSCGWEVVKHYPVFGVQVGDKVEHMMEVYAAKKFDFAYNSRRNMHNNYLDILESFGFTGFLIFALGFLLIPLIKCIQTKDYFGVFVIAAFMLSFVPETYFDRSMGNMIFAFFISFIVSYRNPVLKRPS